MIELLLEAERALTVGMLDQAERLYRQTIEHDPNNSIAVVGLARVAIERGDDRGALEQARAALAIDADNVAAQRLVTRLEEVLAVRDAQPGQAPVPASAAPVHTETGSSTPLLDRQAAMARARARPPGSAPVSGGEAGQRPAEGGGAGTPSRPGPQPAPTPRRRRGILRRLLGR